MDLHFELNSLSMISTPYWHFTENFQKIQKQTVVQWGDTISGQLSVQVCKTHWEGFFYEVIADRSIRLLAQREPFFVEMAQ